MISSSTNYTVILVKRYLSLLDCEYFIYENPRLHRAHRICIVLSETSIKINLITKIQRKTQIQRKVHRTARSKSEKSIDVTK